jgi:hypothetical protein
MHPSHAPLRGQFRTAGFRRVSHGLFLPDIVPTDPQAEFIRDLEAWRLVLPDDAVFTHLTAAMLAGWWLPALPRRVPVFAAMSGDHRGPRRAGLVVSRLTRDPDPRVLRGQPVDSAAEVLLRCARDLGPLDLVPMIDSARRRGDVDRQALETICSSGRPGVRPLRAGVSLSDPRAESHWEVLLRLFHECMDIPVEPQVDLFDQHGVFVGRADLLVRGTRFVHEYDGAGHREAGRHTQDLRRDRRLAEAAYVRRGYTADDLLNHSAVVMAELDRALGRRHRPSRLARWNAMVAASTYSLEGRRRLMNRWERPMGVIEWSRTAG